MAMPEVSVTWVGTHVHHDPDFRIDRPSGSGDFLFLCFVTPVHLRDSHGMEPRPPGACIIYPPGEPQWYSGVTASFQHHWAHFHGRGLPSFFRRVGLPLNRVFYPGNPGLIAGELGRLRVELAERRRGSGEIVWHWFLGLCWLVSRSLHEGAENKRCHQVCDRLHLLRRQVHDHLQEGWPLARMARAVHLSPSRFSVVYRQTFGISPGEDLLVTRLERAGWLLTNTALSITEVAIQTGFESLPYFSRQFKRRMGVSPRGYYQEKVRKRV
ncbi:MAG: AraC family transcriptional regulator [Verrucomicrobiae bacterium]|nr:AraC family transcriptional regulator [Verrucomicrobiae bacterium]